MDVLLVLLLLSEDVADRVVEVLLEFLFPEDVAVRELDLLEEVDLY